MKDAVIIEAIRTPFGRYNGAYRETPSNKLLAIALNGLMDKTGLDKGRVDDVIAGAVTQIGEQAADVARQSLLMADFPITVPAVTLNRFVDQASRPYILPRKLLMPAMLIMSSVAVLKI
jgi:acetyl-CoA acyltransferase